MTFDQSPLTPLIDRLTGALSGLQERRGLVVTSLALAGILLLAVCILVRPGFPFLPRGLAPDPDFSAILSADPWHSTYYAPYRILAPLLAWLVGLRGENSAYFNFLTVFVFIATVHFGASRRYQSAALALTVTACLAFSSLTWINIFYLYYYDTLTYLIVFLMLMVRERVVWFWLLFIIGIFNRESIAFLLPFFGLLQWQVQGRFRSALVSSAIGAGIAFALYLPFHHAMSSGSGNAFTLGAWLGFITTVPRGVAWAWYDGAFGAFRLLWTLPLAAILLSLRQRAWFEALLVGSAIAGAFGQSLFAYDTTRMATLAFPALVIAIEQFRRFAADREIAVLLLHLVLLDAMIPHNVVVGNGIGVVPSLFHLMLYTVLGHH